jgi:hypothetical protein
MAMGPQVASTPRRAAERNRRQRQHGRRLREQARGHQASERRRVRGKLADAWQRCAQRVEASQRRALLARIKCLLAGDESREAAHQAMERSKRMAREARERADARRP